jgi:transcriptional regulator with XRE-family HTH domain
MDLGSYLIQVRNERGYSQRDLAEKSGVSPAEISRVESGKRQKPSPAVLRAIADTLVISYPYLMQLAGYMDETAPDEAPATEDVFRDESTGRIVDVSSGAREMLQNDAAWANVAYRVSRELSEEDRQMLTVLAMQYLKKNQGDGPWNR